MPGPAQTYKRSWKNLLINKRYQLRFTLFMVGLAALLMTGLGVWVMKEANDATTVSKSSVAGEACPELPVLSGTTVDDDHAVPMQLDDDAGSAGSVAPVAPKAKRPHSSVDPQEVAHHNASDDLIAVKNAWCLSARCTPENAMPLDIVVAGNKCDAYVKHQMADPAAVAALRAALIPVVKCEGGSSYSVADAEAAGAEHHVNVQLDESSMTMTPAPDRAPPRPLVVSADYPTQFGAHFACVYRSGDKMEDIEIGRLRILWVLVGTGLVLVFGLAIYGIKMTHRVAGPLFKVSLYLAKMKDGRYDKVWNLRKGDQLVEFYEHFKGAHAGVVELEKSDIEQSQAVIAAAKEAGAGESDAVKELEALVARKEKALE
jgi:hypothetical protein